MAKPKLLNDGTIEVIAEDISELEEQDDADMSNIFMEFGGAPDDKSYKIKVYRIIKDKGEMTWLFDCVPSELPIHARLRDEHEGGNFEARIYQLRSGKFTLIKKRSIPIEAPKHRNGAQTSDLAAVLQVLTKQQEKFFEQIVSGQKGGNPSADPVQGMTSMLALFREMRELNPPPPPQNTLKDTIETLSALKDLMPDRGGGETNFMDILGKVIESPAIGHILQMGLIPKPGAQGQLPNQAAGTQGQPAQAARVVEGEIMENPMYVHYVALLVKQAQEGNDPRNYAGVIFENVGAPIRDEYLLQPDSIERAKKVNPGVALYEKWFMELQAELRTLVADSAS